MHETYVRIAGYGDVLKRPDKERKNDTARMSAVVPKWAAATFLGTSAHACSRLKSNVMAQ